MALHNLLGVRGEEETVKYLKKLGYKIIERNFRCKLGELDIVALYKKTLIFIEVKTRTSDYWGQPIESIGRKKLHSLVKTAQFYMISHKSLPENVRIDAVEVIADSNEFKINHIKNITL